MKKILILIAIAFLASCGSKQAENSVTSSNVQLKKESTVSNPENVDPEVANPEKKEEINCGPSHLLVTWDDPDQSGTNIRNSPGGKIIAKINPSDFPDGCMLEVVEQSNGWFRIQGGIQGPGEENDLKLNGTAWIHGSVIKVGTRNYGGQTIQILDSPKKGKSVGKITTESYGLSILDLCGSWVKISHNGITGWVSSDWLCGVPWTTCS